MGDLVHLPRALRVAEQSPAGRHEFPEPRRYRRSPAWWAANLISLPIIAVIVWVIAKWTGFLP
jgi:hypothetical protein